MNSIGGKTLSPDIIGTATISGAKLFLMKDLKLIYIFQDKLIIKFYFKVTKRNANLPFLSVNFPSVCSEITSQIVCKFLQIIVAVKHEKILYYLYKNLPFSPRDLDKLVLDVQNGLYPIMPIQEPDKKPDTKPVPEDPTPDREVYIPIVYES